MWRQTSGESHERRVRRRVLCSCSGLVLSASFVLAGWPFVGATGQSARPILGALAPQAVDRSLAATGFGEVVIAASWSSIEPAEGRYSVSGLRVLQSAVGSATAAGLRVSLDLGTQYAPGWVFAVGGGTHFVSQYGQVFGGSLGSGNDVPNAVTDPSVRNQMGSYISYLGTHLSGVSSVRLGGGPYNELRYPSGSSGSQSNSYWFYDTNSQASLPSSVRGWKPGTGTPGQAKAFLDAYNAALVSYGRWLVQRAGAAFPGTAKLEVLLPGWGERSSEIPTAENNLLKATPDEINQGLDWGGLFAALPHSSRIVAYTTWADATTGSPDNPDPAAYIHSLLPSGMLEGGESTGNGQTTTAGESLMFSDATRWDWYVINWCFTEQPETPLQVDQALVSAGNA